jgi:hypothetical protein
MRTTPLLTDVVSVDVSSNGTDSTAFISIDSCISVLAARTAAVLGLGGATRGEGNRAFSATGAEARFAGTTII